ncbi:hypothetical protein BVX94_00650 [bacterium B17]|nr:hypothetical protein BVX94_00650 [bacterium B17]
MCHIAIAILFVTLTAATAENEFYISSSGDDGNDGRSPQRSWATLEKASSVTYTAGARILLHRRSAFNGALVIKGAKGTSNAPVVIDCFGTGIALPEINSAGYSAGVSIEECAYLEVKNLDIVSDGGKALDKPAKKERFGIYISKSGNVSLEGIRIHNVFATVQTESEGKDGTTAYGHGVRFDDSDNVSIANCVIGRVGRYGINGKSSRHIKILNNATEHTGCSGLQMGSCTNALVKGNVFNHPGSVIDERMHGRGSGSWVWGCENILYDRNRFLNARGKADSCGVHIDFNCKNVVIQHCFSMNNEGGFIEILGNNHNCAYRYNISVNDGFRKKGIGGARQDGKVFWLSGYCGQKPRSGPFNSYIYNNTFYVKNDKQARFSISPSTRGALVVNNIFHLTGGTSVVAGDQRKYKNARTKASGVVFRNNVYVDNGLLPPDLKTSDCDPIVGDAGFRKPGGNKPGDYRPSNVRLIKDRGVKITKLPEDDIGIAIGMDVKEDFFGNPIKGKPDIGAIEFIVSE